MEFVIVFFTIRYSSNEQTRRELPRNKNSALAVSPLICLHGILSTASIYVMISYTLTIAMPLTIAVDMVIQKREKTVGASSSQKILV